MFVAVLPPAVVPAASQCGIQVEARPYSGHLTLARGSTGADLGHLVQRLSDFAGSTWTATRRYLMESRLGAGAGRIALHETYAAWRLRGQKSLARPLRLRVSLQR